MVSRHGTKILFLHQQLRSLIAINPEQDSDPVICYCSYAFPKPFDIGKLRGPQFAVRVAPIVEDFQSNTFYKRTIYGSSAPHSVRMGSRNLVAYGSGTFSGGDYHGIVGFAKLDDYEFTEFPLGSGLINHISLGTSRSGSPIAVASSNDTYIYTGTVNESAQFWLAGKTKLDMSVNATATQSNGPLLAAIGDSSTVLLLRAPDRDGRCRHKRLTTQQSLQTGLGVSFSNDGRFLAAAGKGLFIWDLRNPSKPWKVMSPGKSFFNVLWTKNDSLVVSSRSIVHILRNGESKLRAVTGCTNHLSEMCDCHEVDPNLDGIVGLQYSSSRNSLIIGYTNGLREIQLD